MKHFMSICVAGMLGAATLLGPSAAMASPEDDTMRVGIAEEILNLDYNYTTKREYIILSRLTDATLFEMDPATNEIMPSVAETYNWVDNTTLDVTLRQDVTFHDGTPLTADDVVYTYNFIISDEGEAQNKGIIERWLDNAEKTGPYSVRFHIKSTYPLVLRDMSERVMLRKEGAYHPDGTLDKDAMADNLIGAGRYKVVSFEPGQELDLERFADYFGEKPAIENIIVRNIPDMGTQQAELMSGGLDWMFKVPLDVAEAMGAAPNATHLSGPDLRIGFLVLDANGYTDPEGPLTKVKVRQAINHAINKEEIAKYLIGGSSEAIHTPCHPAQFGCDTSIQDYPYDPEQARELIAEAGYPDGFPLELWAYRDKAVAEAVSANLEAVGIKVNLRYVKLASLNQARADRQIAAYFGTWGSGGTADTAAIARVHFTTATDRDLSNDKKVQDLIYAAEQTVDPAERKKLYSEAETIIADQAYWAPMMTYSANYLVSPHLDFPLDPDGLPRLYKASWK